MRISITFILLSFFSLHSMGQDVDPEIETRILELEKYSSIYGTWEGQYQIKSAPDIYYTQFKEGETEINFGIKIILSEADLPIVFMKYDENEDWSLLEGDIQFVPDQLAWHLLVVRQGGVWIERYWISFNRTTENQSHFTVTRSVHNWLIDENIKSDENPEYYSVFGEGTAEKI